MKWDTSAINTANYIYFVGFYDSLEKMLEMGNATLELGGMYCLKNAVETQGKEDGGAGKKLVLAQEGAGESWFRHRHFVGQHSGAGTCHSQRYPGLLSTCSR